MKTASGCVTALTLIIAAGVSTVGSSGSAQTYPTRPIKAITDVGPGGTYDIFVRALGEALQKRWGQPLVMSRAPAATSSSADAPAPRRRRTATRSAFSPGRRSLQMNFFIRKFPIHLDPSSPS